MKRLETMPVESKWGLAEGKWGLAEGNILVKQCKLYFKSFIDYMCIGWITACTL